MTRVSARLESSLTSDREVVKVVVACREATTFFCALALYCGILALKQHLGVFLAGGEFPAKCRATNETDGSMALLLHHLREESTLRRYSGHCSQRMRLPGNVCNLRPMSFLI